MIHRFRVLRHLSVYLPGFAFAGATCVMLKHLLNQNRYSLYILRVESLREDLLDNTIMIDLCILSLICCMLSFWQLLSLCSHFDINILNCFEFFTFHYAPFQFKSTDRMIVFSCLFVCLLSTLKLESYVISDCNCQKYVGERRLLEWTLTIPVPH